VVIALHSTIGPQAYCYRTLYRLLQVGDIVGRCAFYISEDELVSVNLCTPA